MKGDIIEVWDNRSHSYSKVVQGGMASSYESRGWQEIFTDAMGPGRYKVLDVGTGPGVVAFLLSQLGHEVTAVDLSEGMLTAARRNAAQYGLDIRFEKGDAEALPFPDSSFDIVVSKYVLWTVPNPAKALSEWYRVVRPGGKVIYVDGNWNTDLESSWWRRRWRDAARLSTALSERRYSPRERKDFSNSLWEMLWSTHADRPAQDLNMMGEVGFENISTVNIPNRRVLSGMRYFQHGYWKGNFLVRGTKGSREGPTENR